MTVLVRPEAAVVHPAGATGPNIVPGRLLEASFRGSYYLIHTEHAHEITLTCEASVTNDGLPAAGQPLALWLESGGGDTAAEPGRIRTSVRFFLTKLR